MAWLHVAYIRSNAALPFSDSKRAFLYTSGVSYFCLIFLRLVQEGVLFQVSLNKLYVCDGTASWLVVDVGGSDVREQPLDHIDEVGLDSPGRTDDGDE